MSSFARYWLLDPEVTFLNHGSFGACPRPVLEAQRHFQERLEREPVLFIGRQWEAMMDEAREALGAFVGANPDDIAFVPNATTGVNTVLRSLELAPGDEILTTDHSYNACLNAVRFVSARSGATIRVARIPFPLDREGQAAEAVMAAAGPRTRLALLDHVTSPTGLVLPVAELVAALSARGIDALVDGAHAPGMVPLDLERLGAAYYTGNCHKWLCTPKGSAFLHVRRDRQPLVHPLSISHGANSPRSDRSRFRLEFDFTGTVDPSPYLCIPEALRFMSGLVEGGWPEVMARNRALALEARATLCEALGVAAPAPDPMVAALAAVPLPPGDPGADLPPLAPDPLMHRLFERFRIEVLASVWPKAPGRVLRVSAQLYNDRAQYQRLAGCLNEVLAPG